LSGRLNNGEELDRLVASWTQQHTAEEVMMRLQENGAAAGVVQDACDLADDPQLRARGFFIELGHPELGKTLADATPIKLSHTPAGYHRAAPTPGQDNDYVYRQLLGMTYSEITELMANGVI
jgi:crotonobetainyl-CoA:carnitine CoA-transferase CaiB-like acyl-CoA transferase